MVANLHCAQNMGHVGSLPAELKVHVMQAVCAVVVCCIFMVLIDLCSSGGYLLCVMLVSAAMLSP